MAQSQANLLNRSKNYLFERHAQLVSRLYDKWADGISKSGWYQDQRVFDHLDRIGSIRPRRRVLEIGFGDGTVMGRLARKLPETNFEGIDVSHKMHAMASRRCRWLSNVTLKEGDWVIPVLDDEPYDIILVKNTLHLLWSLDEKLRTLSRVSHSKTQLFVVETISPSRQSLNFISGMFRLVDREGAKVNYFTKRTLLSSLRKAGWGKRVYAAIVDQKMSVDTWLKFKTDSLEQRAEARNWILDAPDQIATEMNISDLGGDLTMLRRQIVLVLRQNTNNVLPFKRKSQI